MEVGSGSASSNHRTSEWEMEPSNTWMFIEIKKSVLVGKLRIFSQNWHRAVRFVHSF
jgi:hypothetical protein